MKKVIVMSTIALLAIIGGYIYVYPRKPLPNPDFVCAYPNYSLIKAGQNHEIVKSIMG